MWTNLCSNLSQIAIKTMTQDVCIIYGHVVGFEEFSNDYLIKGLHLLICILLKKGLKKLVSTISKLKLQFIVSNGKRTISQLLIR